MSAHAALAVAPPEAEPAPEEAARPRAVERFAGRAQALSARTTVTYDAAGRVRQRVTVDPGDADRPVARASYEYDAAGRLTRRTWWRHEDATSPPSVEVEVRRYDPEGRLVEQRFEGARGELTGRVVWSWRDGRAVQARRLDARGEELERDTFAWAERGSPPSARVVRWTHRTPAGSWTVTYERGPAGRLERKIHSRDGVTTYRYDAEGRLVERTARGPVQGGAAPGAPTRPGPLVERVRYEWDAEGRLRERVVERHGWPRPTRVRFVYRYAP